MQPLVDRGIGASPDADGWWVPDEDQVLVWRGGLVYTVPRFQALEMLRGGVYAALGALVIDATLQGLALAGGHQDSFDGAQLAESAGRAGISAAAAYAVRIALLRALPQVSRYAIGGAAGFTAAIVVSGAWETGRQGVGIVRGDRNEWDVRLIGRQAAAPVTDLVRLPVTAWRMGNALTPARRRVRADQRAWRSQTFIPDLSTLSARLDAIPEPQPREPAERRHINVGFGPTPAPSHRHAHPALAAAVLVPTLVIASAVPSARARLGMSNLDEPYRPLAGSAMASPHDARRVESDDEIPVIETTRPVHG